MKQTTKAALLGAILATAAIFAMSPLMPSKAQAAVLGAEQYKVINCDKIGVSAAEGAINSLAEQGWRVKAGGYPLIILAK